MDEMIYILINEAMPGYVKIGRTTNLEQRIRSLDERRRRFESGE